MRLQLLVDLLSCAAGSHPAPPTAAMVSYVIPINSARREVGRTEARLRGLPSDRR